MTANNQLRAQTTGARYIEGNRFKSNYEGPKRACGLVFGVANQKLLCLASASVFVTVSLYKVHMLRRYNSVRQMSETETKNIPYIMG